MSVSSILLFVGATTLVAALVTLCAFQINAAKLERRIDRRSRTLEGPVPGHRSLSSIGLNADAARSNRPSSRLQGLKSASTIGLRNDSGQEPGPSPLLVPSTPSSEREGRLNSLQTIQARSAALHGDDPQAKPANLKPLTLAQSQVAQRQPERDGSDEEHEQGLAARRSKKGAEKAGSTYSVPSSHAPGVDPAAQAVAPRTSAPKRAKRASVQSDRIESSHPTSDQAPSDALADAAGPESAGSLQSSGIGGPVSQDDGLPDIFAGLDEAYAGTLGVVDDLSDVDGGGLPGAAPKIRQKSRR